MNKVKAQLGEAATKAKSALSEIKADGGTTGFQKIKSMFVNPWKSETFGRAALIACPVAVLLLGLVFSGCGKSNDTLVIKGLYMRMPGDAALEACKELVASSTDLTVVDFRNGIEIEREVGLGEYEKKQMEAYEVHMRKRSEAIRNDISPDELDKMGLYNFSPEEWKKLHPPSKEEIAASKKKIKEIVSKKNLIQISIKKDGTREDKLDGLCFVWIDDTGNVRKVYFNKNGMDRFFNAGDLSGKEFAQALVNNYSGIPNLTPKGRRDILEEGERRESVTWTYKDPKGYQVTLHERVYFNRWGQRRTFPRDDVFHQDDKYLSISAIKAESERKFD